MLLKGPENTASFAAQMSFTKSARVAWEHILRKCWRADSLRVLLPAYIGETDREGSGVFDPVRELECEYRFYPVSNRLVPDTDTIARTVSTENIDVLLAIHYFGFVQSDMPALRSLCDKHNIVLVEDCAHVCLLHGNFPGATGDYGFFSLHKFLPTDTGGALRANDRSAIAIPADDRCDPDVLEQLSRTNLSAAAEQRRRNYAFLFNQLSTVSGLTLMYQLDESTVPHDFPTLIHNNQREALYFHLQSQQMPTIALYYRLVSEIDPKAYPVSFEVSDSILNLPVHQDTSREDLEALAAEIRRFLGA